MDVTFVVVATPPEMVLIIAHKQLWTQPYARFTTELPGGRRVHPEERNSIGGTTLTRLAARGTLSRSAGDGGTKRAERLVGEGQAAAQCSKGAPAAFSWAHGGTDLDQRCASFETTAPRSPQDEELSECHQ